MSNIPTRKIIPNQVMVVPEAETLISDILVILQNEISQIAMKSKKGILKGESLGLAEARVLQGYAKSLVELSKESREQKKGGDLSNMSDDELLELVEVLRSKKAITADGK